MPAIEDNELGITVYAPPLTNGDERPLAIVRGVENALPGLHLDWTISREGQRIRLQHREKWLAGGRPDGRGFPLVCNEDTNHSVSVTGWELPAASAPGGEAELDIHVALPLSLGSHAAKVVLEVVAESAHAFWGHATPLGASLDIARQTKNWDANPRPPPRGLPALKLPEQLHTPETPHRLGWLNYWSTAASRTIGFPEASRDGDLLSRSRQAETGGWLVQLTDAPLDLDDPAHLEALLRAYERFPAIGGRASAEPHTG